MYLQAAIEDMAEGGSELEEPYCLRKVDGWTLYVKWIMSRSDYRAVASYLSSTDLKKPILPLSVTEELAQRSLSDELSIHQHLKSLKLFNANIVSSSSRVYRYDASVGFMETFRSGNNFPSDQYYELVTDGFAGRGSQVALTFDASTGQHLKVCLTFKNSSAFDAVLCSLTCLQVESHRDGQLFIDWALELDAFNSGRVRELQEARKNFDYLKSQYRELDAQLYQLLNKNRSMEELYVRSFQRLLNDKKASIRQ